MCEIFAEQLTRRGTGGPPATVELLFTISTLACPEVPACADA
jgi:hypothetical protein